MSHFSKIKTDILDLDILKKTLRDLGYEYSIAIASSNKTLFVYDSQIKDMALCSFEFNGKSYSLVADLECWSLKVQFDNFLEKLKQQYACNIILQQSNYNGFEKIHERIMNDGSVKLVIQRWS